MTRPTVTAAARDAGFAVRTVPYGRPALTVLRDRVNALQAGDRLATVTVVVATKVTGLALRRALAADGGIAAVRFALLAQVAELLAARRLAHAGRRPLSTAKRREYVRLALQRRPGALRSVAGHAATERVVEGAIEELRAATAVGGEAELLTVLDGRGPLPASLAGLFREFRALAAAHSYDEHDLALTAAEVVRRQPASLREVGPVVLHLPRALTPAEQRLTAALADRVPVEVILGDAGDPEALRPARALAAALHASRPEAAAAPAVPDAVVDAPDQEGEVRHVLGELMRRLRDGGDLSGVAVLYRDAEPYATLAHELLDAADLPHNGPATRSLAQTIAGRCLLDLLAVADEEYARHAVFDWLGGAPVRDGPGRVPAKRWGAIAVAAQITAGQQQWHTRLTRFATQRAREAGGADLADGLRERFLTEQAAAEALDAFVTALAHRLSGPAERSWWGWSTWLLGLLDHYLGAPSGHASWPQADRDAEVAIRERIAALVTLDDARRDAGIGSDVDRDTVVRALRAELDEPAGRVGRFGVGAYLGPVGTAGALAFDEVFVLGMVEGAFPHRPAEQPLLTEADRVAIRDAHPELPAAQALALRADQVAQARAALFAALAAGEVATVLFPRADRRRQRARMPAPWLLELAGRRAGRAGPVGTQELGVVPGYRRVASFSAALAQAGEPVSEREWVARELLRAGRFGDEALAHPVVVADAALADAIAVERARQRDAFTPYDGLVGPHPWLEEHLQRAHAATSLADYGHCPRRYFLGKVLRVAAVEPPVDPLDIDALDRGTLMHTILERYVAATIDRAPADADAARELLHTIADEEFSRAEASGATGRPLLWQLERDRLRRQLDQWLVDDAELQQRRGVAPVATELAFGDDVDRPAEVLLPSGRALRFHGRIDRLDASAAGDVVVVTDYKTGSDADYKTITDDPVARGRHLQLGVYGVTAQQRHPAAAVRAQYWFVDADRRSTKQSSRGFELDEDRRERVVQVLDVVASGIADGLFPARPGDYDDFRRTFANCRRCPFDTVCPAPGDRERAWHRARDAPQLAAYRELAEGDDDA